MNFRTESFDLPQKEQRRTRSGSSSRRSEEHTSELQSQSNLVCRLLLEKKNEPPAPLARLRPAPAAAPAGQPAQHLHIRARPDRSPHSPRPHALGESRYAVDASITSTD